MTNWFKSKSDRVGVFFSTEELAEECADWLNELYDADGNRKDC